MVLLPCIRWCNKYDIFTWPQYSCANIFWNGNLYKYLIFLNVFRKKGSVRGPYHNLQMSFWYPAAVELKSFGFSCVVVGKPQLCSSKLFSLWNVWNHGWHFPFSCHLCFSLFPFVFLSICSLHFQIRLLSSIYRETFWLKWMFYRDHSCV